MAEEHSRWRDSYKYKKENRNCGHGATFHFPLFTSATIAARAASAGAPSPALHVSAGYCFLLLETTIHMTDVAALIAAQEAVVARRGPYKKKAT
jgi:hypothetical protein